MASRVSSRNGPRVPFGDATSRANTPYPTYTPTGRSTYAYYDSENESPVVVAGKPSPSLSAVAPAHNIDMPSIETHDVNKRHSAASRGSGHSSDSRRASQYSSCDGFPNKKSYIGPWQLGKTLGKGSSARVRAARHSVTHQAVAVKIIAKKTARMTQSGSIAHLDQVDRSLPESINGVRRMPLAIEREVAILKLIEHPNICKLYDIWENRNEIYLILEYVENGDMFTYVSRNGALTEEASLFVFRQMMSAVQYCHSHNICHRDLKLENILLKSDGQIKIADFGMAALHQGPRYQLQTSCGSPHYAAPELLKARPYRGDKSDIWSMGVILFVMLAGRLPFDEDDMGVMLAKAKKGIYTMPSSFSSDAKDLVHRILQTDPEVRISMNEMWQHPLVWKYGYLDDLGNNRNDGRNRGTQMPPLDLATIDTQIFRQLRSMWHSMKENDLAAQLVSNEPNDQKLFYWLLYNYRERQLENFNPTLTHSMSDYHHVNKAYSTKVSTRQFSQTNASGHKRSISRFTVISNVAETEAGTEYGTIKSYDPYKASPVMRPNDVQASHAKIVVHRNSPSVDAEVRSIVQAESLKARAGSTTGRARVYSQQRRGTLAGQHASRGSMSSIRSVRSIRSTGRHGTPGARPASRYRRGVDFSNIRKTPVPEPRRSVSSVSVVPSRSDTLLWNEDLSDFSCKIAKDLDEAFMSSLLTVDIADGQEGRNSPFSLRLSNSTAGRQASATASPPPASTTAATSHTAKPAGHHFWDSRPLPPSPPRSDSVKLEIMQVQVDRAQRKSGDPTKAMLPNSISIDMTDVPAPLVIGERRVVSAPAYTQAVKEAHLLPSISEAIPENWPMSSDKDKPRAVSAPTKNLDPSLDLEYDGLSYLAKAEHTIRVVMSPTANRSKGPAAIPRPLNLQKKPSRVGATGADSAKDVHQHQVSGNSRHQHLDESISRQPTIVEEVSKESLINDPSAVPARKSWLFRRQSKPETRTVTVQADPILRSESQASRRTEMPATLVASLPQTLSRKKSLIFPFWKSSKNGIKLGAADADDVYDGNDLEHAKMPKHSTKAKFRRPDSRATARRSWYDDEEEPNARKIEPQQNWLARLFRVKPARRHLCLGISQRRARQEISLLLREWRHYGIRDIDVDKERNIIFARVASNNCKPLSYWPVATADTTDLGIREVSLACEIITVIEHGKRNHLSIIRLTQEKGSANSFHKVADTVKAVMRERHLLVADKRKAKMMVKTLNS